ncbi:MAG: prepilin-type N-terminal cleavage/methylation domain-containing protein [Chloroflexi bacterium]|nr:prepilin-type N-terminal cleavage/methylation domain-containing protein [Chloroflexota bacterium]
MRKLVRTVRNAFRYGEAGFTLIELLVVIGILAALAGVVTLAVTQFIGRGQTEACQTDFHNVQTAVAACMVENNGSVDPCDNVDAELVPTYLLQLPLGSYTVDANGTVSQTGCPR